MLENTISVCIIAKNEEKNLKRCLESIKNIADEIVVVDTGSEDKTFEIAKLYTDKVFFYQWDSDFSKARNKSLEYATKNWILILDADEELPKEEGEKLKEILKLNINFEAFHVRLVNYVNDKNIGDSVVLRVFKNRPKYRFVGKIHEQIIKSINENSEGSSIGSTDIKIIHYGYDPNKANINEKQQRNLNILNSYKEEDKDGYFYYSLGNEYARIKQYDKALDAYKLCEEYPIKGKGYPIYLCYLAINIAKTLSSAGRFKDEIEKLQEAQRKYPNFRDLYFLEYLAHVNCGHFSKAKKSLEMYVNIENQCYEYPNGNYEKQFNIDETIESLNSICIEHEKNLLSVIILLDKNYLGTIDTVRNINEIADEVIIAVTEIADETTKELENIYVKVLKHNYRERKEMFMESYNKCNGKFILLLKPNESLTIDNQRALIKELTNTSYEYFYLNVLTKNLFNSSSEFRVMKNIDKIKSYKSFDEYLKYIDSRHIEESNVQIKGFND